MKSKSKVSQGNANIDRCIVQSVDLLLLMNQSDDSELVLSMAPPLPPTQGEDSDRCAKFIDCLEVLKARFTSRMDKCSTEGDKALFQEDLNLINDALVGVEASALAKIVMAWSQGPLSHSPSAKPFFSKTVLPADGENNCGVHAVNRAWASAEGKTYDPSGPDVKTNVAQTRTMLEGTLASLSHDATLKALGPVEEKRLLNESLASCKPSMPLNSVAIHAAGILKNIRFGIAYLSSEWVEWVGDHTSTKVCMLLYDHRIWVEDGKSFYVRTSHDPRMPCMPTGLATSDAFVRTMEAMQ